MELLHKAALYAVLSFVIVGAAISLAGPDRVATTTDDGNEITLNTATTQADDIDLARGEEERPNGS